MSDRIEAEILDVLGEEVAAAVDTPLVVIEGPKGDPGAPGKDGHSPVVTATKSGKTTTISVDGAAIATVEDGADGSPVNWRGAWEEDTEYSKLDAVSYDGSSYIFTSDTHVIGSIPGVDEEWGLMAQKGNDGANGVTPHIGDNGHWYLGTTDTGKPSRGETGPQGTPGIYYGTTQPTGDTHPVWIDPDGGPDDGGLLPVVTAADNGKVLRVVNSAWSAEDMPTCGTDMGITGATVGQIAKITAVDGAGKPTAWSPVDMPSGGGGETWELLSDTTIDEDANVISMAIQPCKKIKAYFEGHQVFSDGSETSTKFTTLTVDFDVDGNQGLRAFYTLNEASRFNSDVVSVITFDVSSTPFASGELFRIFPNGQNTGCIYYPVSNEIAITAASAITKITIRPKYKFVSGVGNVGCFASGGRLRVYGVRK